VRKQSLIAVADDADEVRALLVEALHVEGYDVIEARDGRGLLELLQCEPDAIITDFDMPELNGIEALREIRCRTSSPVIFITGLSLLDVSPEALALGAVAVLPKPFELEALWRLLPASRKNQIAASTLSSSARSIGLSR